jgi:hypothetical protein
MIVSDIINASLRGTLDDVAAAKWTDAELAAFLADGVRYIQTNHPQARMDEAGTLAPVLEGSYESGTDTIRLDPIYQEPLRDYVLWRCFSADKGDSADARRAAAHERSLIEWFTSRGA